MKRFIFLNMLFILITIAAVFLALTSVMLFDAPGSENNKYVWIVFWSSLALPVTSVGAIITSCYYYFKSRRINAALRIFFIPTANIAMIVTCLILIQWLCHGNFSCR